MLWKILVPIIASALIGWGAWATVQVTSQTPREVFDKHVGDADDKFWEIQKSIQERSDRIEDKLDKIQEKL